jgi:hypothetical protein
MNNLNKTDEEEKLKQLANGEEDLLGIIELSIDVFFYFILFFFSISFIFIFLNFKLCF